MIDENEFKIIKGFIESKNDKDQTVFMGICSVCSMVQYLTMDVIAVNIPVSVELPRAEFLAELNEKRNELPDPAFYSYAETQVSQFIKDQRLLSQGIKQGATKSVEAKLVKFVAEALGLRAIAMMRIEDISPDEAQQIIDNLQADMDENKEERENAENPPEPMATVVPPNAIILICQPVLDPVNGLALSSLQINDRVLVKMPEDSYFHAMFRDQIKDFNGILPGTVLEMTMSDTGSTVVKVELSEGIIGIMHLSGNMRVKTPPKLTTAGAPEGETNSGMVFAFVIGGAVMVLAAVLLYAIIG